MLQILSKFSCYKFGYVDLIHEEYGKEIFFYIE